MLKLSKESITGNLSQNVPSSSGNSAGTEAADLSRLMLDNFEAMLETTGGMMKNMGSIEGGVSVLLKTVLQIINSFASGGGAGGILGGLFGSLLGLLGGPIGSVIGGVLGSGLNLISQPGRSVIPGRQQSIPVNNFSGRSPNIINQVIIKNPVTFSRAYDVEVRSRLVRGGIDL
jgi:hypothetical protein